jgi:hypothetical protein
MRQKSILVLVICQIAALVVLVLMGISSGARAMGDPTPTLAPIQDPVMGEFDPESVADIDVAEYPIIPEFSDHALTVYREGLDRGNNPHAFTKMGDCMTDDPNFLLPIGEGEYDLVDYVDLQPAIDQFIDGDWNSFARASQAAEGGFNAASILDTMWANPEFCEAGETPLSCEFRLSLPSVALMMFGTNDVYYLNAEQFDFFLRSIIAETLRYGTLPIVSTFPYRAEFPDQSVLFNQIIIKAAEDYDIPLINLALALEPLPDMGVDAEDTTHMTSPEDGQAAYFTEENLQTGFTTRNLVTLQTLQALLDAVSAPES